MSRREYRPSSWFCRRLKPGMTVLTKASSSLTDLPTEELRVYSQIGQEPLSTEAVKGICIVESR
jgi:hypothetical protein